MYADFNSSKVHSAQILALLRSPDVREQAVGKMFFEALPGLHAQSHVPLKSDLRDAALELRRTPYENGETAAIRDYLERPCEHPAVRPSA